MSKLPFTHHSQSKYTLGKDLNLLPFDLFNHVQADRLHPLDDNGEPMLNPDVQIKLDRQNKLEADLRVIPLRYGRLAAGGVYYRAASHYNEEQEKAKIDNEHKTLMKELEDIKSQLAAITDFTSWANFELPEDKRERQNIYDLLLRAKYKTCETKKETCNSNARVVDDVTADAIKIGHSDFLRLFAVDFPEHWYPNITIKTDGVWIVPVSNDIILLAEERATTTDHPKKDLSKPVLHFPCSYKELQDFMDWLGGGISSYVDSDKLDKFLEKKISDLSAAEAESKTMENTLAAEAIVPNESGLDISAKEPLTQASADEVVFSYVSPTEVMVKCGSKRAASYKQIDLGFKKEKNPKAWNVFLDHLKSGKSSINFGKSGTTYYDNTRKIYKSISDKLVDFLKTKLKIPFPHDFKLFEKDKTAGPGIYKSNFRIGKYNTNSIGVEDLSDDKLMADIKKCITEQEKLNRANRGDDVAETQSEEIQERIIPLLMEAQSRGLIADKGMQTYLNALNPPEHD